MAEDISIGGIVSGLRPLKTRKGDRMCVFMLDDADGSIEVVVFPEAFKQFGHLAENGRMVAGQGEVRARRRVGADPGGGDRADRASCASGWRTSVAIRLSTPPHGRATFEQLWDVFAQHKGDRRVAFDIELQRGPAAAARDGRRQRADPGAAVGALVSEVEKICGAGSVSLR